MAKPKEHDEIRKLAPAPGVQKVVQDDRAVLLDSERGEYFGLNSLGVRVWRAIEEDGEAGALVEDIAAEYGMEPGVVDSDIRSFLETLIQRKLVVGRHG